MEEPDMSMRSVRVTVNSSAGTSATVLAVPADAVHATALVPALHGLDDALLSEAKADVDRQGREITCLCGCTACCYQMVPVTEQEARFFVELVDNLPTSKRDAVRTRATEIVRVLEAEGLLLALEQVDSLTQSECRTLAIRYFRMKMPCPFLEGKSCSIYDQRPLSCREYLVTSPPERCERFGEDAVERVPLPISLFSHLTRTERASGMPLVLAFHQSGRWSGPDQVFPGPEYLARLLGDGRHPKADGPTGGVADCLS